jgi:hypothetical protein
LSLTYTQKIMLPCLKRLFLYLKGVDLVCCYIEVIAVT